MKPRAPIILWLDCLGGLSVGVVVIALAKLISDWEQLPLSIVVFMGLANLGYGAYSLYVTTRQSRPLMLVSILAFANMAWLVVCIAITIWWWNQISILGLIHVLGEGVYVGALGYTEWRMREDICSD